MMDFNLRVIKNAVFVNSNRFHVSRLDIISFDEKNV